MELYTNPASPFCRKVHVLLLETGQQGDVTEIAAVGHPTDTGTMPKDVNPIGKIPVLVRDDGPALFDSRVICRFLDARAGGRLYPDGGWDILTLESIGDGICDAAVLMVYEGRSRPDAARYAPWVEGQWSKVTRSLDALEARWMSLLQAPLNIGQIAVACALAYLDFRHEDRDWRKDHPELAAWHSGFAERPSMQKTAPPV
ncbi:MAG: glutathione S-transferase family protein [Pseudomonadota bacterium]